MPVLGEPRLHQLLPGDRAELLQPAALEGCAIGSSSSSGNGVPRNSASASRDNASAAAGSPRSNAARAPATSAAKKRQRRPAGVIRDPQPVALAMRDQRRAVRRSERPSAQSEDIRAQHLERVGGSGRPGHRTSSILAVETASLRCNSSNAGKAASAADSRAGAQTVAPSATGPSRPKVALRAGRHGERRRWSSAAPPRAPALRVYSKSGAPQINKVRPSAPPSMQA